MIIHFKTERLVTHSPLASLLCWVMILISLSGCGSPPAEEIPDVDFALHNEQAIDRYLKQLLDSEDRKITGFTEAARWGRIQIVEELLGSGIHFPALKVMTQQQTIGLNVGSKGAAPKMRK